MPVLYHNLDNLSNYLIVIILDILCVFVIISDIMDDKKAKDSLIKIGEASELMGIAKETLREWHKTGELVPAYVSRGGRRYYTKSQIDEILKGRRGTS